MRIIVRRIYRAFPELDRFSDEQCQRFVKATRRGWRRLFHWLLILLASAGMTVVAGLGAAFAGQAIDMHFDRFNPNRSWAAILTILACVPILAIAPLTGFIVRDLLLRWRLRYVLRARGSCPSCHYTLIGLPVSARNIVVCPECGLESEVDPSLGELVLDDRGKPRFKPSPQKVSWAASFFTPKRTRTIKRVAIIIGILILVGMPATWGGYEIWLRRQANLAQSERPGDTGLTAFAKSNQPPVPETDTPTPSAWAFFDQAQSLLTAEDGKLWRPPAQSEFVPSFDEIYAPRPPESDPKQAATNAGCKDMAMKCLAAYRAAGVFDRLHEMAACRWAAKDISFGSGPSMTVLLPELGQARNFARINSARMTLAAQAKDLREFTDAMEANFALARMCYQQPFLIDTLVAIAIEAMTYTQLRELLATHPDEAWLDAIDAAIARQKTTVTWQQVIEGEHQATLDNVAWFFSDPDRVRAGRFSPVFKSMFGANSVTGRLGTYVENRDAFSAFFKQASAEVGKEFWKRQPLPDPSVTTDLILVKFLMPSIGSAMRSFDLIGVDRRSYPVLSALERYRARRGDYPQGLEPLVPELLGQLPADPFTGRWFCYKKIDPASDAQGRGFLLYSTGSDMKDDGGNALPQNMGRGVSYYLLQFPPNPAYAGFDFIINDRNR